MVTRVETSDGRVLHDCTAAGCDVSWDGHAIRPTTLSVNGVDTLVTAGVKVPGNDSPDPALWTIDGDRAILKDTP